MAKINLAPGDDVAATAQPDAAAIAAKAAEAATVKAAADKAAELKAAADQAATDAAAAAANPNKQTLDAAAEAKAKADALSDDIEAKKRVVEETQAAIAKQQAERDTQIKVLESEGTKKASHADIVRKIQQQTTEQAIKRKTALQKAYTVMKEAGIGGAPSLLDAALAMGGNRSRVLQNGTMVVAQNPRSREGAANHARYLRQQHESNSPAARGLTEWVGADDLILTRSGINKMTGAMHAMHRAVTRTTSNGLHGAS